MKNAMIRILAAFMMVMASMLRTALADDPPPPPALQVEVLAPAAEFTDDVAIQVRNKFWGRGTEVLNMQDASNIVVAKVTIQPKAVFPWHTHPGPVLISVVQGNFVYTLADDCLDRWYLPGTAVIDAGFGNVHTAFNPDDSGETIVIATFLGVPAGDPVTIVVPGPDPAVCPLPAP